MITDRRLNRVSIKKDDITSGVQLEGESERVGGGVVVRTPVILKSIP